MFVANKSNDLANLQALLERKEAELSALSTERTEAAQRLEETDAELFKLRAKCRDVEYILNSKEETIRDLQQRLESLASPQQDAPAVPEESSPPPQPVKVSSLGAGKKGRSPKKGRGKTAGEAVEAVAVKASASLEDAANNSAVLEGRIETLNGTVRALEQENASLAAQASRLSCLDEQVARLEEKLAAGDEEKRTLQKRIDFLLGELDSSEVKGNLQS